MRRSRSATAGAPAPGSPVARGRDFLAGGPMTDPERAAVLELTRAARSTGTEAGPDVVQQSMVPGFSPGGCSRRLESRQLQDVPILASAWLESRRWGTVASIRHLSKAPIIEAVMDFRARLAPEFPVEDLRNVGEELAAAYPNRKDTWLIEGSIAFSSASPAPMSSSTQRANGYAFWSADGKQVAQFRLDGFTFSRLAPYTSWDEIAPQALRLWERYRTVAKPEALYRIAVRYINQIVLPDTPTELDDIITCAARIPLELPQLMAGFLSHVDVPLPRPNTYARIVQSMGHASAAPQRSLLLDVDVFRAEELDPSSEVLRPIFDELRTFKDLAFFGSLTEEAVRQFV